mgnify:CR=1 FL=1
MNEDQAEKIIKLLESIDGKLSSTAVSQWIVFDDGDEDNMTEEPELKREEVTTSVAEHLGSLNSSSKSLAQHLGVPQVEEQSEPLKFG